MKQTKLPRNIFPLFVVLVLFINQSGCSKDYSFEGANIIPINPSGNHDSIPSSSSAFVSGCSLCRVNDVLATGKWNFKNNKNYFCGNTTDAGFIGTGTTFTFFGPSACSIDTGLVMTVYLPFKLNENKFNLTTDNVAFYYYDHLGRVDMFIRRSPLLFSVTISSYIEATRIVTGTFEGSVYKPNGDTTYISDGKFKMQLK